MCWYLDPYYGGRASSLGYEPVRGSYDLNFPVWRVVWTAKRLVSVICQLYCSGYCCYESQRKQTHPAGYCIETSARYG